MKKGQWMEWGTVGYIIFRQTHGMTLQAQDFAPDAQHGDRGPPDPTTDTMASGKWICSKRTWNLMVCECLWYDVSPGQTQVEVSRLVESCGFGWSNWSKSNGQSVNPYPLAIQPGNAKTNLQKYGLNIAQDPSKDSLFHQKNGQPLVDTQFLSHKQIGW